SARALARLREGDLFAYGDNDYQRENRLQFLESRGNLDFDAMKLLAQRKRLLTFVAGMWHGRFDWLTAEKRLMGWPLKVRACFEVFQREFCLTSGQALTILEQFHETQDRSQ
ncbi:MAG: hypothetical protein M1514_03975, partial [Patescibacteria group bacterium]|nr:hypothetical protein [Patescibacteria group bacterium]